MDSSAGIDGWLSARIFLSNSASFRMRSRMCKSQFSPIQKLKSSQTFWTRLASSACTLSILAVWRALAVSCRTASPDASEKIVTCLSPENIHSRLHARAHLQIRCADAEPVVELLVDVEAAPYLDRPAVVQTNLTVVERVAKLQVQLDPVVEQA